MGMSRIGMVGVRAWACSEGVGILVLVLVLVMVVSMGLRKRSWFGAKDNVLVAGDFFAAFNPSRRGVCSIEDHLSSSLRFYRGKMEDGMV